MDRAGSSLPTPAGTARMFSRLRVHLSPRGGARGAMTQFLAPNNVAVDAQGRMFIAGCSNHRVQVFTADGKFSHKWGSVGSNDGQFNTPCDIAVDGQGRVLVVDSCNHRVQVFTAEGNFLAKWGTEGDASRQQMPSGIGVGADGKIFVTDPSVSGHHVQVFASDGTFPARWGPGEKPMASSSTPMASQWTRKEGWSSPTWATTACRFSPPMATSSPSGGHPDPQMASSRVPVVAVDSKGRILVAESGNKRVQVFG